jgi:hypothetical protein
LRSKPASIYACLAESMLQGGEFALIWQGMSLERALLSAQGYLELEMPDEALREIDALPQRDQLREEVLQMRLFIAMLAKQWEQALLVCARLRTTSPKGATAAAGWAGLPARRTHLSL